MPSPDWTDIAQAVGTLITALTSIALVYVAINFRDEARAARRRPELTLSYDQTTDTTLFRDPNWNYDITLRVENKPGQDRALSVGLELVEVQPLDSTPPLPTRPPRRPFAVAELNDYETTTVDLHPNVSRRFLFVYHDIFRSDGKVELGLIPRATESGRDRLPPGKYEVKLALTAANADATYWTTTVLFKGISTADEEDTSRLTVTTPRQILESQDRY